MKESLSLPAYTPAALPSADDFDGVMTWLVEKGLIQNTYQYDDLVDKSFVK